MKHEHVKGEAHDHAEGILAKILGPNVELIFTALSGLLLALGWWTERQGIGSPYMPLMLFIGAYGFGGFFTLKEAIEKLKAQRFEIDMLMLVAAAGAAALGQWAEGALLLFLFGLGHGLEHHAMAKAQRAIEALGKLAPERARVRRGNEVMEVPVEDLVVGDTVLVRPNERLPIDGVVIQGHSSVDQAVVTGESVPVEKMPSADPQQATTAFEKVAAQHKVFAATINGSGALEVRVAKPAGESAMARMSQMVMAAQTHRSPTQSFTEKFERIFVPVIFGLVSLLMFAWLVVDEPFSASFYRAMAVLVAASPCALAISVPSAVLSGVARAGQHGVLIKGGAPLENLGVLRAMAFDKTGTLTEGKPRLTDVVPADSDGMEELLTVALAVELHSDHPLAGAVTAGAYERLGSEVLIPPVDGVRSITGKGVVATIEGREVSIGKLKMFDPPTINTLPEALRQAHDQLIEKGRTTMLVYADARWLGILGVMDTPRKEAAQVMKSLQALGISRTVMISGDNQRVADAIAKTVGLTHAQGDLMPEDKINVIQALLADAGKAAMVGDGVNDAPAMASATVGIAMGAAGSDVALETADVALMADDLTRLPFAVGLSRQTRRIIRQNLWLSLGMVAILIPATILGLSMGTAVLFHEGSTLLVVFNALRLLAYEAPDIKMQAGA